MKIIKARFEPADRINTRPTQSRPLGSHSLTAPSPLSRHTQPPSSFPRRVSSLSLLASFRFLPFSSLAALCLPLSRSPEPVPLSSFRNFLHPTSALFLSLLFLSIPCLLISDPNFEQLNCIGNQDPIFNYIQPQLFI